MNPSIMKPRKPHFLAAVAGLLLLAACASQMEPAKQALDGADSAIQAASTDASKYMPDQLASLQGRLSSLKTSFDNKDYAAVLANAATLTTDAQSLAQAAAAKKDEAVKALAAEWTDMASTLPKLMDTVKARVEALGKVKHAPKGIDLQSAKAALADATSQWTQAQSSSAAGQVEAAVNAGKSAKMKLDAAADALKLKLSS